MKLKTQSLITALSGLKSMTAGRTTLPIIGCVKLESADGKLTLSATDLDQWQSESIECDGDIEPVYVNLNHFTFCLFRDVEQTELLNDGEHLVINCGSKAKRPTMMAEDFPAMPLCKSAVGIGVNCADLGMGISEVFWAASKDESRSLYQTVHVIGSAKSILCESVDGMNGAFSTKLSISANCDFLIPSSFASKVSESLSKPGASISTTDNQIFVKYDSGIYVCKQAEGNYPDTCSQRNAKRNKLGVVKSSSICDVLRTCIALSDKSICPRVEMVWSKTGLVLTLIESQGEFSKTIEGKFTPHSHHINANALLMCLAPFKDGEVIFSADESCLAMQSGDLLVLSMNLAKVAKK